MVKQAVGVIIRKKEYKELLQERIKKVRLHVLGDFTRGQNHFYACYDEHEPYYCVIPELDKGGKRKHIKGMYKSISRMDFDTANEFSAYIEITKGTKLYKSKSSI